MAQKPSILVLWHLAGGKRETQACATADVARAVIKACREDPKVVFARAFYTDERGAIDGFDRQNPPAVTVTKRRRKA